MDKSEVAARKQKILGFMKESAYRPLLKTELSYMLDVPQSDLAAFYDVLDEMESEGIIFQTKKLRYGIPDRMSLTSGRLQGSERGFGFVIPDEGDDVFIPPEAMNGAMHGDRVVVRITKCGPGTGKTGPGARKCEGEIIKVLEHANERLVGTYEQSGRFGFLVPDHARITGDIMIAAENTMGAENGQKVVIEMLRWPEANRNAEGKVVEILGSLADEGVDVLSIIRTYQIPFEFPEAVVQEAVNIPSEIQESDIKGRRDLRSLRMVTIDGEDARDLDDAITLEPLGNGVMRLGVHIADVTHYVRENSALDEEALLRGTSVYFPDRVVPMLPKELSNGICSLNQKVDRLAFSVLMDVDTQGTVLSHDICESVIHVGERMTYTAVYKILEEQDQELSARYADYLPMFQDMKKLAGHLKEKRIRRGSVDFMFDEAKVVVDESGKPIDIKRYPSTIANSIIEEFMLLCNEVVSEHFFRLDVPFVYRIHEDPTPEKMQHLRIFLLNFGYTLTGVEDVHPSALQKVLVEIRGKPEERAISMVMLRSLQKARYSNEHVWHFGLAAEFYSHFTSPIRRYPDLIIHRIMKEQLSGKLNSKRISHYKEILPSVSKSCSDRERAAADAEREAVDMKKAEYMSAHVGEEFDGILSSVTAFGMFVELDNTVEGLVRVNTMMDDYYRYDPDMLSLTGERTGKEYRIGDTVRVQLVKSSPESRQIDFLLISDVTAANRPIGLGKQLKNRKPPIDKKVLAHVGGQKGAKKGGKGKAPAKNHPGKKKGKSSKKAKGNSSRW